MCRNFPILLAGIGLIMRFKRKFIKIITVKLMKIDRFIDRELTHMMSDFSVGRGSRKSLKYLTSKAKNHIKRDNK